MCTTGTLSTSWDLMKSGRLHAWTGDCVTTCAFYFKTFTLIPFLLHYYHVTFHHVRSHMTHSIPLPIIWPPHFLFSHDSLFPLWVIPLSLMFPHESLWLRWLYVSPTISDSQWFLMNHSIVYLWLGWEPLLIWLVTRIPLWVLIDSFLVDYHVYSISQASGYPVAPDWTSFVILQYTVNLSPFPPFLSYPS